jgi:transcriptional regulator of acetoin/glycerol metabolism
MKDFDDSEFYRAYEQAQFEIAETARTLGVSRQAVYRRIERCVDLRLVGDIADEELSAALLASGQDVVRAARLLKVSSSSLRNRLNQL